MISCPGTSGNFGSGSSAVDDVQIGPAHRAGSHRDQHLLWAGARRRQLGRGQGAARGGQHLCTHEPLL